MTSQPLLERNAPPPVAGEALRERKPSDQRENGEWKSIENISLEVCFFFQDFSELLRFTAQITHPQQNGAWGCVL